MTPPAWTAPEGWLIPLSAAAPLISHTLNRLHSGLHVYPPGGRQGSPCQSLRDYTNTKQESGVGRKLPESGQDENPDQSEQRPSSTRNGEPGSAKPGAHRERGGRGWGGLSCVVGFLGTSGVGLMDTVLAARLRERCRLSRSRFCLEDWSLFRPESKTVLT